MSRDLQEIYNAGTAGDLQDVVPGDKVFSLLPPLDLSIEIRFSSFCGSQSLKEDLMRESVCI